MGRARQGTQEPVPHSAATEEIALVLLAGGSASAMVAALAPLLLLALPAGLLRFPDLAAEVATEAARLAVRAPLPVPGDAGGIVRQAAIDNALYRSLYAREAARRLGEAALEGDEALAAAKAKEERHLAAHEEAGRRRLAAARSVEALVELHGPVLSWLWGETRTPEEPRPHHRAAHRKNWRPSNGPPVSTGALPGVLPGCSCAAGAPVAGAEMLT